MLQTEALDTLKLGHNVFLTGAAGAGKTYVLNQYIRYLQQYNVPVAITASTGIAATHIGGQTIHSWCGFGTKEELSDADLQKISEDRRLLGPLRKSKVLVIDEISMLHARQLDLVEVVLRAIRNSEEPFGGIQIVLCGDFFQLPPVGKGDPKNRFAFQSRAWRVGEFKVCYLHEQHRQGADPLLQILNDIRFGRAGEHTKVPLRTRYKKPPLDVEGNPWSPTLLYSKNVSVDAINEQALAKLEGEPRTFLMTVSGKKSLGEGLKKSCLAPEKLVLKVGAEVMFIKNSPVGQYVNGTRGVVEYFEPESGLPEVRTLQGDVLIVDTEDWRIEESGETRASISQLPLRLAWAITIHKSQGMTLDAAEVDLSDAFEPGMGYVALSRVRSLNGLKLMGLNEVALQVHPLVRGYDQELLALSELMCATLTEERDLQKLHSEVLFGRFGGEESVAATKKTKKERRPKIRTLLAHELTRDSLQERVPLSEIAASREIKVGTVLDHIAKLKLSEQLPDISYLREAFSAEDFNAIMSALKVTDGGRLKPVWEKFEGLHSYDTIRVVRLFLE